MTTGRTTMSTTSPAPRGTVLAIDAGSAAEERVLVLGCTQTTGGADRLYPTYTLAVRRVNRWDRLRWRTLGWPRAAWRRAARPVRDWWWSTCDRPWCWRQGVVETRDDVFCARHADTPGR